MNFLTKHSVTECDIQTNLIGKMGDQKLFAFAYDTPILLIEIERKYDCWNRQLLIGLMLIVQLFMDHQLLIEFECFGVNVLFGKSQICIM